MKIFVTGGTGFIGSHFINQAHAAGHQIAALRRTPESKPRVPLTHDPEWLDCAMDRIDSDALLGCECVVHLAAHSANFPYDSLENCILYNVIHPLKLFRAAMAAGIKRFIVAGSCFEYGRSGDRYDFIPIDAPLEPTATYPASKAAASVAFHAFASENNLELAILRIFQVYGEGELETRFWPSLRKAALEGDDFSMTDGLQIRDFIDVKDVANAILTATSDLKAESGIPSVLNIASGNPQTLADFARNQWQRYNGKGNLLVGSIKNRPMEIKRLIPDLGIK